MITRNNNSLTNDTLFKMFFTKNKKWLARLIHDVTGLDATEDNMSFMDKELFGDNVKNKKSNLDLLVRLPGGEIVFLEMQNRYEAKMPERLEFYKSKVVVNQVEESGEYGELKDIYAIVFINYSTKEYPEYLASLNLYNTYSLLGYRTVVNLNIINLTKDPTSEHFSEEINCLLRYMASRNREERKRLMKENVIFEEIYDKVEELTNHPDYWIYDIHRSVAKIDENTRMLRATRKAETRGRKEGIEQGIEQGVFQNKIETAKNLLNQNVELSIISNATSLNIDKIKELKLKM